MKRGYIKIPKRYRKNLNNYIGFGLGNKEKMTVGESMGTNKKPLKCPHCGSTWTVDRNGQPNPYWIKHVYHDYICLDCGCIWENKTKKEAQIEAH